MVVELRGPDNEQLVEILKSKDFVTSSDKLEFIIKNADLKTAVPAIDSAAEPDIRIWKVIERLSQHGPDDHGNEALGRFLNYLINKNKVTDRNEKDSIKTLIEKYSMISSPVPTTKQEELEPPITVDTRVEPIKNEIIKHDQPELIIAGQVIGLEKYRTSAVSESNLSESKTENIFEKHILEQEGGINETKFELRRIVNVSLTVTEESLIIQAQSAVFIVAKFQTDYNNTFKEIKRYLPDLYEKVSREYDELCSDIEKLDDCFKHIRDKKGMLDSVMKSVERHSVECWRIVRDTIFEWRGISN